MDDNSNAIAVGLGAGLGGFAGLLIIGCICWQICCGSWCDKKTVQSTMRPIPLKTQRIATKTMMTTKIPNDLAIVTPTRNLFPNYSFNSANDLASKVKSVQQR